MALIKWISCGLCEAGLGGQPFASPSYKSKSPCAGYVDSWYKKKTAIRRRSSSTSSNLSPGSSPQLQDVIIVPVKYTNKNRTCTLTRYGNRMLWFTRRPKWMTGHSAILALWFRLPETSFCRETGKRLAEFKYVHGVLAGGHCV
uniref:Uncharacterized protein n=1 Tax=Vespula pensylvanica TaxID=30213 RepID=A0A834UDT5_VESPE|nr:hypothetical protein H0235_002465 [Vespula pensylvanica]